MSLPLKGNGQKTLHKTQKLTINSCESKNENEIWSSSVQKYLYI